MLFGLRASRTGLALCSCVLLLVSGSALGSVESELAFHRGVIAFGEDETDEADRQFQIVLQEDPEDTVSLHYLGLIAQKRDDDAAALGYFDRALAIDPEDTNVMLDRGIALMDLGRMAEARAAFDQLTALEPDDARAHLFAGIVAYRVADYDAARPLLDKAAELDPSLRAQSRYFGGLADALRGNIAGAQAAFEEVASQSPATALGQSARDLRRQIEPRAAKQARRWEFSVTTGFEYDSNPTILADFVSPNDDGRWIFLTRASYDIVDRDDAFVSIGMTTYLSTHFDQDEVDLQSYTGWVGGGYDLGFAWIGLRYDYSFTFIDLDDPFRHQHRITPTFTFIEGEWGATNVFYRYYNENFLRTPAGLSAALNRDGHRHVAGVRQLFFPNAPISFLTVSAHYERNDKDGTEWDYDGWELSAGAGIDFSHDIDLVAGYRFWYRYYDNKSLLSGPPAFSKRRRDKRHIVTVELGKDIGSHWRVAVSGAFNWNGSNVRFYDYDRQVGGLYVTYAF